MTYTIRRRGRTTPWPPVVLCALAVALLAGCGSAGAQDRETTGDDGRNGAGSSRSAVGQTGVQASVGEAGVQAAAGGVGVQAALSGEVRLFAASSLTDVMNAMAHAFTDEHPDVKVIRNFASSSRLAIQLIEGAPADVLASANPRQMALVVESGRIAEDTARVFAHNQLVAITPQRAVEPGVEAGSPGGRGDPEGASPGGRGDTAPGQGGDSGADTALARAPGTTEAREPGGRGADIREFADIATPDISMVLAAPAVPVRDYTDRMIDSAAGDAAFGPDFRDAFYANLASEESNVRQVSARVALGEADLGVVYATDVTRDIAARVHIIEIPEEHNVMASYPIASLEDAVSPDLAGAFVDFVLSDEGRRILADYSFTLPEGTH